MSTNSLFDYLEDRPKERTSTDYERDKWTSLGLKHEYVCIKCGVLQPTNRFKVMNYDSDRQNPEVKRTCYSCMNANKKLIKRLSEENPYPDRNYVCPGCDRTIEEIDKYDQKRTKTWHLDHCHDTESFRGWLCHNCNTKMPDDLTTAKRFVKYLEDFEGRKHANGIRRRE